MNTQFDQRICTCTSSGDPANCLRDCYINHALNSRQTLNVEIHDSRQYQPSCIEDGTISSRADDSGSSDGGTQIEPLRLKAQRIGGGRMGFPDDTRISDQALLAQNRVQLDKFEALKINDASLAHYTIGGFQVDLATVAEKAREIIPLPPAKLPQIFIDKDLNFYHHWFGGFIRYITKPVFHSVLQDISCRVVADTVVFTALLKLLQEGYCRSDTESSVFLKRTLGATFEIPSLRQSDPLPDRLTVATNIFGFQFLEPGMQCDESELRMFLAICYDTYKSHWYNALKATGVPDFAVTFPNQCEPRSSELNGSLPVELYRRPVRQTEREEKDDPFKDFPVSRPKRRTHRSYREDDHAMVRSKRDDKNQYGMINFLKK